jgi:hypothetical protein
MLAKNIGGGILLSVFRDEATLEQFNSRRHVPSGIIVSVERYSPERKAEFLLNNAVDEADYRDAQKEVQKLGLDPDSIPHLRPA